ncbi:apoptosis-associated speck-like protein containing a CARD [Chanos chanos]|uniref:Apoptosis-associated speck-like protein containing a CARD n=1 Tax=Chanos chanos TaxID=29144 RepID=A0A6J2VQQ5_CHACN|nr:apoptosis-associated speck-like protein containing a CARD [Chanos chanos]
MANMSSLLLNTLEELGKKEFSKFKWYLKEGVSEDFTPIPKGKLEDTETEDVVDLMRDQYGEEDAGRITVLILREMRNNHLAEKLNKNLKVGPSGRASSDGAQFVDKHRANLIQRVTTVEPIADELHSMVHPEKYSNIRAAPTPQEKMRRIFDDILVTQELKERFYKILLKHEPYLVKELAGSG